MKKAKIGRVLTILLVAGTGSHAAAQAQETVPACSPVPASTSLTFKVDKRTASNVGVDVASFVLPTDKRPVVNGVDVSKYQDAVDFQTLRACEARFVFIRLSAGTNPDNELRYRDLWKNARSVDLMIGGYHNFNLREPKKPFSSLAAAEQEKINAENAQRARDQAQQFLTRLEEMSRLDGTDNHSGRNRGVLPPVLDLSWQPQAKYAPVDAAAAAPGYRAAVCEWIDNVRNSNVFNVRRVIIYTRPQLFVDFELDKLTCLKDSDDLWLSVHTPTGDGPASDRTIDTAALDRICNIAGRDRCRFQQYTSFGRFALFGSNATMNLDRFWGTVEELESMLTTPPSMQ